MTKEGSLPPQTSFQDVQLKIRDSYANPNTGKIAQVVLKEGPRAFKIATVFEILDPSTGSRHHFSLRLDHIDRTKRGWFAKPEKSFRAEGEEIGALCSLLRGLLEEDLTSRSGELHIINSSDYERLADVVGSLENLAAHDRLEFVKAILTRFEGPGPSLDEFASAFENARSEVIATIGAAARLVEYRQALAELRKLIEDSSTSEGAIQAHLAKNPWMFGSEYSELLPRRAWTRDESLDFMLRRTVDGYLEIVEIKTPGASPLFRYDPSHNSYYVASALSRVVGQVLHYISEVEKRRDAILANDREETLKIRARIIVGRDGDADETAALRQLNAHLARIEVFTFDQLLRIAERVVSVFESNQQEWEDPDEAPF